MLHQSQNATAAEAELLGDLNPLLEQIGSPDGLASLVGGRDPLAALTIRTAAGLRSFLEEYHKRILQPLELPAIQRAFTHARQNELRELIAYDQHLATEPALKDFSTASRIVGLAQLQRLRPLRDDRFVQRYLAAVETGSATGWHTLVYGLTLAVYHLPLRPGLVGYAQRTTQGFIQTAARSLNLASSEQDSLIEEFALRIPSGIELIIPAAAIT